MPYTRLFLLVEGDDDARFVERVVVPALGSRYNCVQAWKFAQKKPEKVNAFLRSIKAMGADYLLLGDLNAHACFPKKKEALLQAFIELESRNTLIVVREIESWYLAGLKDDNPLGVQAPTDTSGVTKEQFNDTMPKGYDSRIAYMIEVLKHFDIRIATTRNPSFHYFAKRCGLLRS
ncbi:MAG TPA: hypothetical protein VEO19_13420 [Terriglobia bacterium]|nr:hypothetical protein [Terriglobia bacterium]